MEKKFVRAERAIRQTRVVKLIASEEMSEFSES